MMNVMIELQGLALVEGMVDIQITKNLVCHPNYIVLDFTGVKVGIVILFMND